MPVPRIEIPKHKISENEMKLSRIEDILNDMGYACDGSKSVVKIIETFNLDVKQFDFPYGSFAEFKKQVENDAFDEDCQNGFLTKEESEKLHKDIAEGKICVTY